MILPTFDYERKLTEQGFKNIAGADEAGRGSWAGPIVASAVVFSPIPPIPSTPLIRDSKKLSPKQREVAFQQISSCAQIGVGIVEVDIIDKVGIGLANKLAFLNALMDLDNVPSYVLLDYLTISSNDLDLLYHLYPNANKEKTNNLKNLLPTCQKGIKFGDNFIASISAASIVAKVTRDHIMIKLHNTYPDYNFRKNKGYPSKEHRDALKNLGPSPIHRKSFSPIGQLTF